MKTIKFNTPFCVLMKDLGHAFRQRLIWYKDIDCMLESCKLFHFSIMYTIRICSRGTSYIKVAASSPVKPSKSDSSESAR